MRLNDILNRSSATKMLLDVNSFEEFMIKSDLLGDISYFDFTDIIYECYNRPEKRYIFDILSKVISTTDKLDKCIFKTDFPLQFFEHEFEDVKEKQSIFVRFQILDDISQRYLYRYTGVGIMTLHICNKIISTYGNIPSVDHMMSKIRYNA